MFLIAHDLFSFVSREELSNTTNFVGIAVVLLVVGFALIQWHRTSREEESREFSDKYYVGSESKEFAYAICHPRMMEYPLATPVPCLEFENDTVALTLNRLLNPDRIQTILERLICINSLIPNYLLTKD